MSSTLDELAPERAAARRAVKHLHLAPVLFELGARPYPPRSLYIAYLQQSQIFIGIYWQKYGWVAPEMDVSGLDDELRASVGMPRLIYMKTPAPDRDPRLAAMLNELAGATVSYKKFTTPTELERVIVDDLALLLTERFATHDPVRMARTVRGLPAPTTAFIGRTADVEALQVLLTDDGPRLVTITGPGGVGKTRLALQVAGSVADRYGGDVAFVPLSSVRPEALLDAIASALGLQDRGGQPLDALVASFLAERDVLLVLDNFEHMLANARLLRMLLEAAPGLRILATSRTALRVSGEQEFVLDPLQLPTPAASEPARVSASEAVQLFANRVSVVRRGFTVDSDNAAAVADICRRLDGLPLALELVAARAHVLSLEELRARVDAVLDLPARAPDVEERHRTLRQTMDWSLAQLQPGEQAAFARLGIFAGPFNADSAEAVLGDTTDTFDLLAALVDHSLLRADLSHGGARFSMLEIVRDYARANLDEAASADTAARHAAHFRAVAVDAFTSLRGTTQRTSLTNIDYEIADIGGAVEWLLQHQQRDEVADITWSLMMYFWLRGMLAAGRRWTRTALEGDAPLAPVSRARLLAVDSFLAMYQLAHNEVLPQLLEAEQIARSLDDDEVLALVELVLVMVYGGLGDQAGAEQSAHEALALAQLHGDGWTVAYVQTALCWLNAGFDRFDDSHDFEAALASARATDDELCVAMALGNLGELRAHQGRAREAAQLLMESLHLCLDLSMVYAGSGLLDNASALLASEGRLAMAVRLAAGASAAMNEIHASLWPPRPDRLTHRMAEVEKQLGVEEYQAAWNHGLHWTFTQAVGEALRALEQLVPRPGGGTSSLPPAEVLPSHMGHIS